MRQIFNRLTCARLGPCRMLTAKRYQCSRAFIWWKGPALWQKQATFSKHPSVIVYRLMYHSWSSIGDNPWFVWEANPQGIHIEYVYNISASVSLFDAMLHIIVFVDLWMAFSFIKANVLNFIVNKKMSRTMHLAIKMIIKSFSFSVWLISSLTS